MTSLLSFSLLLMFRWWYFWRIKINDIYDIILSLGDNNFKQRHIVYHNDLKWMITFSSTNNKVIMGYSTWYNDNNFVSWFTEWMITIFSTDDKFIMGYSMLYNDKFVSGFTYSICELISVKPFLHYVTKCISDDMITML